MGAGKYILGGLLGGLGESLVLNGRAKREEALRVLELNMRQMENERDRTFRKGEADADRAARKEEAGADRTFRATENQQDRSLRKEESAADRQARLQEGAADRSFRASENDEDRAFRLSEGERDRQYRSNESAQDRQFRYDENQSNREVDQERNKLSRDEFEYKKNNGLLGGDDLVEVYDSTSPTGTKWVTRKEAQGMPGKTGAQEAGESARADEQTRRDDAETQATYEADQKAGYFSRDATDFGPEGRQKWIENRTKEILNGDGGKQAANGNSGAAPSGSGQPAPARKSPDKANKPSQYPDAKWSDKAGGWVVNRNGKWYVIEE